MGRKLHDISGGVFGRWTALNYAGNGKYLCRCKCGTERLVRADALKSGESLSCGCLSAELASKRFEKYPAHEKKLRHTYLSMLDRCDNPKAPNYRRYGGRGIAVCDEWRGESGFEKFCSWSWSNGFNLETPSRDMTIDRIDNDGGYSPNNCRWVSCRENNNNRSVTLFYTIDGISKPLADWARVLNIPYATLYNRAIRRGWSVEDILATPVYKQDKTDSQRR